MGDYRVIQTEIMSFCWKKIFPTEKQAVAGWDSFTATGIVILPRFNSDTLSQASLVIIFTIYTSFSFLFLGQKSHKIL